MEADRSGWRSAWRWEEKSVLKQDYTTDSDSNKTAPERNSYAAARKRWLMDCETKNNRLANDPQNWNKCWAGANNGLRDWSKC